MSNDRTESSAQTLRSDYAGDFDPEVTLASFSRQALAILGREYLLLGHMVDRVGLPLVVQKFDEEAQVQFSIDEWMGASPIYSKRMQRALNFEGSSVETVFKNVQLEIGAPPQFMDFQFQLDSAEYGEFWLVHCGALLDVEPFGEKRVKKMCHDIEDPTFDATAAATHPCMKMRPIHRPPRVPTDRAPHCRWSVFIDNESSPYEQHANLDINLKTRIAHIGIDVPDEDAEPGGWADYSGAFDTGLQLEDFSHRALLIVAQEAAVQTHLLVRAYMLCIGQKFSNADAAELGRRQWIGSAAMGALRLRKALKIEGTGIDAVAKIFQLHPHFWPRTYVDFRVEVMDEDRARISIRDCAALQEGDAYSWFAGLEHGEVHPALEAIATMASPHARLHPVSNPADAVFAWDIVLDDSTEARDEPQELKLGRISRGVTFELLQLRPLRD